MACGVHSGALQSFLTEVPHRELLVAGPAATRVFELEDLAEAGEVVLSAETAAPVDPPGSTGSRDGAHLLRALEPGASPIPAARGGRRARARSATSRARSATISRSRAARPSTVR